MYRLTVAIVSWNEGGRKGEKKKKKEILFPENTIGSLKNYINP